MHITEHDLEAILFDGQTDSSLEQIESHVEQCPDCRVKLENRAADNAWREKIYGVLSDRMYQQVVNETDSFELQQLPLTEGKHIDLDSRFALKEIQDVIEPPKHPEMLGRIGRYDVERIVGRGGMGIVVKAFDVELNRCVAIKIMSPALATNGTARGRFAREARAAAAVLHPNVIPIHGVNTCSDIPYLVMPFVAGESLQSFVDSRGPQNEKDIVRIVKQIASGLAAAHAQGLVHRDIKPANILIDNDVNRVLITDFGLARAEDDVSMTRTGWIAGTPNFMSPEQSCGHNVDARSDLFSLGSVTYFLATGRMPFRSDTPMGVLYRIKNQEPTAAGQLNEDLSKTTSEIIERLMEKDPADRFQSATELELFLEQYLAFLNQPTVQGRAPRLISSPRKRRRRLVRIALATIALAAVACLAWMIVFNPSWFGREAGTSVNVDTGITNVGPQSSPLTWDSIAKKYSLIDESDFRNELDRISNYSNQIQQSMNSGAIEMEHDDLETGLNRLEAEFKSIHDYFGEFNER